jgi:hypothetical protein
MNCVVASRMAPVASITTKQAPNWRVATIRISIIGLRWLTSHGNHEHEGECADRGHRDDKARAEPVILEPAVEHDLQCAERARNHREADEIEAFPLPPEAAALLGRGAAA